MGFFPSSSPFDADVEKATNEKNFSEEWGKIMDICDKVDNSSQNAKDCLRSIVKRLNVPDPHVVMQAITLLDACSSNCGKTFHLEIASRDFEGELKKLINHPQTKISEKAKALLKKWAEGDFKTDAQLNLIPSLYNKLRSEGVDFSSLSDLPKRSNALSKDPNVVTNSQEEEDIAKAIELSLKESKQHPQTSSQGSPSSRKSTNLYPNVNSAFVAPSNNEGRKVRALYDFEAAEDNELTFMAGEIIHVLDDSDPNWWKGTNHRGEGLFPANFVTADLSVEPEQFTKLEHGSKKTVQFAEEVEVKTVKREPEVTEVLIDENKMDRLMHLIHEADPQGDTADPREMLELEEQVTAMGPLIDAALEKVDRRHAQLTQLSSDLVEALNLYHSLMREPPPPTSSGYIMPKMPPAPSHVSASFPYATQPPPPPPHVFNGIPQSHQASFCQTGGPSAGPPTGTTGGPAGGPPGGPYNANMPSNEFMGPTGVANVALPQHYQVPSATHQYPQCHSQAQPADQTSLPYQHPGYPGQSGPTPGLYGPAGPTVPPGPGGPPVNQQSQYAPSNGQHMM